MSKKSIKQRLPNGRERTLSIIKPDAVSDNHIGEIIQRFEQSDLHIAAMKILKLDSKRAGEFYAVHKDRPFYNELVDFMTSAPVVVIVLEGDDAVKRNRKLMGATNPDEAAPGTIRAEFAQSIGKNAVHGSDTADNAAKEINFFFDENDLISRF
ncbi:MAG: nucleoside-diphosphate kinase [Chlamydiales bacterium]|nr:nucleoside-diphosphate kinase [Chlamydiia bacterium]MCP5506952.1 nucleoside-diphosphate kinase [Chlamydiales bacterium]